MSARRPPSHLGPLAGAATALPFLLLLSATRALAVGNPIPAAPTAWVTDSAAFVSDNAREELNARLRAAEARFGHQVLVWIGRTTAGDPIEDWAARAFAAWRVGRRGLDDGVVLFIMRDDRKIRIEVGYGLEERLPDARASAIIREVIAPRLQQNDSDGAVRAGVTAILAAVAGTDISHENRAAPAKRPQIGWFELVIAALVGILLIGFFITNPRLAILLLTTLASGRGSGRGGGGFGGGGGFSGGGGRSGGGGATGSW